MAQIAQGQLQMMSDDYQKLQEDLQTTVAARQRLEAQQQENLGVQKEFKNLKDSANIYKMVGPVLLKQERIEASSAVDGRLEYIGSEIKRRETQLSELQQNSDQKRQEIMQVQSQMQQQQEASDQEPAAGGR